jgi:FtsH-binding integral membrane protein
MKDHAFIVTGVLALALVATGLVWIWIQIVQWAIDHPLWSLAIIAFLAVLTWLPDMRVKRKLN